MEDKAAIKATFGTPPSVGGELIAKRYRVERELGRGGMAVVLEVVDTLTGERMALKRMVPAEQSMRDELERLFETEYYSLAQLAHPRVVQVFDYDHEADGQPYYTMELLDGGDLRSLAPLPAPQVCTLLADIASALSLLHSRRLVHRDVTPRNVRCTRDGKAKLIDFGAVRSFGVPKRLVGTAPFLPPEAITSRELDGRSDLFALGATAYFALTNRHAFPARDFKSLRECWATRPPPPSRFAADVPPELDRLIMSLLQLDPKSRPESAAEVIERLSALALIESVEQAVEGQAYLATPTLVGRDNELRRARKVLKRSLRGAGGALLVSGASGLGRSRFLSACALEAKLLGALVLHLDAADSYAGPFSTARELVSQLLDAMPSAASLVSVEERNMLKLLVPDLGHTWDLEVSRLDTRLSSRMPHRAANSIVEGRSNFHSALQHLVQSVCKSRPVVLVVDDVERLDEPSMALCALLSSTIADHSLALVMSARVDVIAEPQGAMQIITERASQLRLQPLSLKATHELLASIVGNVSGLELLVDHVHRISGGVPDHIVQLTQHLVDSGHLRYEAGAWTIREDVDAAGLPQSLDETLNAKLAALSPSALTLCTSLGLAPEISVDLADLACLANVSDRQAVLSDLDRLVSADILETDGLYYRLRHSSLESALVERLDLPTRQRIHGRLAEMFGRRNRRSILPVYHLALSGDLDSAIDALTSDLGMRSDQATAAELALMGAESPLDLRVVFEQLIDHCKCTGRPAREVFALHDWIVALTSLASGEGVVHLFALLDQLQRDCGLDIYAELAGQVADDQRLGKALEGAQKRFDALPEHERVVDPLSAIRQLARTIVQALGVLGVHMDYNATARMPSLAPFVVLSPALDAIHKNVNATLHVFGGRYLKAQSIWQEVLERIDQPDRAQLDDAQHRYMFLAITYAMGTVDAALCRAQALTWADALVTDPLFEVNAERIRMNYYFRMGDVDAAIRHQRQAEILQLKNSPKQMFEGTHMFAEALAYASSDDMLRLKRILPAIAEMADRMPNWQPILHLCRGCYQRLRGNHKAALAEFESTLKTTMPGCHVAWAPAATGVIHVLRELEQVDDACQRGAAYLKDGIDNEIQHAHSIREALAFALATRGDHTDARRLIDEALEGWRSIEASGTLLGSALETAARIALLAGDNDAFMDFATRCGAVYRGGRNPALMARHATLLRAARTSQFPLSEEQASFSAHTVARRAEKATLSHLSSPQERAEHCAQMLLRRTHAQCAFLYLLHEEKLVLAGQDGDCAAPDDLSELVSGYLRMELTDTTEIGSASSELSSSSSANRWRTLDGLRLIPMVLAHHDLGGELITGVAVVSLSLDRDFRVPHKLLSDLSQSLTEVGDVTGARTGVT